MNISCIRRCGWHLHLVYVVGISMLALIHAQTQSFNEAPSDVSGIKGQTVTIKCSINNRQGDVQWVFDGFALGFDRDLTGYPRYHVTGNEEGGEYHLLIENLQLSDDGEFSCQVLPSNTDPGSGLVGKAYLTVQVPPAIIEISGQPTGSEVEVPYDEESLMLRCECRDGKPAAVLTWFRNDEEVDADQVVTITEDSSTAKLKNSISTLTINPKREDNKATYRCRATGDAMQPPLDSISTFITLSVMYPPETPVISGYDHTSKITVQETLVLLCIARGGNPLAEVHWFRNGDSIDFSYEATADDSRNELILVVVSSDNGAVYRCEASNRVTAAPLTAEITLTVLFPPVQVTVTGHQNAKAGEEVTLTCETAISNPPATLSWSKNAQNIQGSTSVVTGSTQGGWVTKSEVTVTLEADDGGVMYECRAICDDVQHESCWTTTVTDAVTVEVLYPPRPPRITGHTDQVLSVGRIWQLNCVSEGGNPLPQLEWIIGDEISADQGAQIRVGTTMVTREANIPLKPRHNMAKLRCNSSNPATPEPLSTFVQLNITFPPDAITITANPEEPKVGEEVAISCRSSSSNPSSAVSWYRDQTILTDVETSMVSAEHSGQSTVSTVTMTPTIADNGALYTCKAKNTLLPNVLSDSWELSVLFKPTFNTDLPKAINITEKQSAVYNFSANANPSDETYAWKHNGDDLDEDHVVASGGVLTFIDVTRQNGGTYSCEAKNTEGTSSFSFNLNVQYPAKIIDITDIVKVAPGENATMKCEVDANPLPGDAFKFQRTGYDMSRPQVLLQGSKLTMSILAVVKDDLGMFQCTAQNGIGDTATANAALLVKFPPMIEKTVASSKAAAETGHNAVITCNAEGEPAVSFTWTRNNELLDVTGLEYKEETKKIGSLVHYQSQLTVYNTNKTDYGPYTCMAHNELGTDTYEISLDGTSGPDPPTDIQFYNATHNSVTLSWTPGFDGGSSQWFRVRYAEVGQEGYHYVDVVPPDATSYTIKDLKLATEYMMTVRSINRLGQSDFQEDTITVRTAAAPYPGESQQDSVPLIIILTVCIVGMVLLGLNVLLILFFIRRRRRRMEKEASETGSQANTLEMLSARTITEDSKSYSTYDRRSMEDFHEPPGYQMYEDDDEVKGFLGGPAGHGPPYYGSPDMYAPTNPAYYPSTSLDYVNAPVLDQQRSFLVSGKQGSREPLYLDDQNRRNTNYEVRPPQVSTVGGARPRTLDRADNDDYAQQLRQMQKNLGPNGQPARTNSSSSTQSRQPPPPPARSSSKDAPQPPSNPPKQQPPLPARNYTSDDVPRYGPPPGSAVEGPYGTGSRPASTHIPDARGSTTRLSPADPRGHLV